MLECQSAAASLRRFSCVAALSGKLQDTLVMTEEQLDVALGKVRQVLAVSVQYTKEPPKICLQ